MLSSICICFANTKTESKYTAENVTFYQTPLVCGAAPEIGCGSRARPLLLELEQQESIKEAWLNRPGTVIAVVWNSTGKEQEKAVTARTLFTKHKVAFDPISKKKEQKNQLSDFTQRGKWYRSAEVDQLSIEEAGVIAKDLVNPVLKEGIINEEEAAAIQPEIEAYFKEELVKEWSDEKLKDEKTYKKWQSSVKQIYAKHIGEERSTKVVGLYKKQQECKQQKKESCCEKGKKKSCCTKSKNES
ncbi:MAG: hypothetical protein COA57_07800 [Flavobacteriales bacterium]|nr:MAG: hypothetical protein COA57_07800 [Flavobacteriales bacterium]